MYFSEIKKSDMNCVFFFFLCVAENRRQTLLTHICAFQPTQTTKLFRMSLVTHTGGFNPSARG